MAYGRKTYRRRRAPYRKPRRTYRKRRVYGMGSYGTRKRRSYRTLRGLGAYNSGEYHVKLARSKIGGGIGTLLGGLVGGLLGPGGAAVGAGIGGGIGGLIGLGSYKVNKNSLLNVGMGKDPPYVANTGGRTVIRHREFLGNILSTTDFTNRVYHINPGLKDTFPWLNKIASQYEQHRWLGLGAEYRSLCSNALNSTNLQQGVVIMSADYDAAAPAFISKQQMENSQYTTSCKPSDSFMHMFECSPTMNQNNIFYNRNENTDLTNRPLQLFDLCKFQVATEGMQQAGNIIGELWLTFDVEFLKSILSPEVDYSETAFWELDSPSGATALGNTQPLEITNAFGVTLSIPNSTITFPASVQGDFLATYLVSASTGGTGSFGLKWESTLGVAGIDTFHNMGELGPGNYSYLPGPTKEIQMIPPGGIFLSEFFFSISDPTIPSIITLETVEPGFLGARTGRLCITRIAPAIASHYGPTLENPSLVAMIKKNKIKSLMTTTQKKELEAIERKEREVGTQPKSTWW